MITSWANQNQGLLDIILFLAVIIGWISGFLKWIFNKGKTLFIAKKENKMENEDTKMNITSYGQSGGITAGIVNISNSNQYVQPSNTILSQVENNLKSLISEFPTRPKIIIEVESGNSQRHQTACDLEKIFQTSDLGVYPKGNTYMGRFPNNPITVIGNKQNFQFYKKFVNAINPYIPSKWHYEPTDSCPDDFLKIYINGTPTFSGNGSVNIT